MNHTDLYHNKLAQLCVNLREQLIHVYANLYLTPPRSQVLASTARFSSFTATRSLCSCTRLVFSVVFNIRTQRMLLEQFGALAGCRDTLR